MKKIILFTAILIAGQMMFAQLQLETTFTTEGIETVIGNTGILIDEPLGNKLKDKKAIQLSDLDFEADVNMKIGVESVVTESGKSLALPLKFSYNQFDFSASIPYFFNKKMKYSLETAETSGLGDISAGIGHGSSFAGIYYYLQLDAKLPTGDDGKMEDGYLVPLGSGSTDFMASLSGSKELTESTAVGLGLSYKYNGSSSKKAEISRFDDPDNDTATTDIETVDYTITNGNVLSLDANFEYYFSYGFSLDTQLNFKTIGEGSTDKEYSYSWNNEVETFDDLSNKQDVTMLDLKAIATYSFSIFDLSAGVKIPLMTERHEDNLEEDRGMSFFTRFDYTIF